MKVTSSRTSATTPGPAGPPPYRKFESHVFTKAEADPRSTGTDGDQRSSQEQPPCGHLPKQISGLGTTESESAKRRPQRAPRCRAGRGGAGERGRERTREGG